jgi:hypothetical protein
MGIDEAADPIRILAGPTGSLPGGSGSWTRVRVVDLDPSDVTGRAGFPAD